MKPNIEIAKMFRETALLYEMEGVEFKPRAYERAAATIAALDEEVSDIMKREGEKGLDKLPGIGTGIAGHIAEIKKTGTFKEYKRLRKKIPVKLEELSGIGGLGPKTIKILYKKLKIKNLRDLERQIKAGKIGKLPGFGKKSEEKLKKGIEFKKKSRGRFLLGYVKPTAEKLLERVKKIPGVKDAEICGSYRRWQETIGDIDIQAAAADPEKIIEAFVKFPEIGYLYGKGPTKANVRLRSGIEADLRVVPKKSYGAALQYFTGDKMHNIEVRKLAVKKGYKLNEYGLFQGKKRIAGKTEEEIYKKLGLEIMPPELRTASGEIETAKAGKLPKLIGFVSLKGDLQVQTNWTDGEASIAKMAEAAKSAGLSYIAVTDHTKTLAMTGGLDEKKLSEQGREIDKLNKKFRGFRILKSAEVNILKDGKLDIADAALKKLDLVACAVHTNFGMSEKEMTERIVRALKHPLVNILFHPTGRLIGKREPYKLEIMKILRAAKQFGAAMEVNAYPERLDLRDTAIRDAVKLGVKLVVDSDAHAPAHFQYLELGIAQVRRGWGGAKDVLNTRPVQEFLSTLRGLKKK